MELVDVVPDGDRLVDTDEAVVPFDELWGISVRNEGTLRRGQTFARVDLIPVSGGSTLHTLAKGYVHGEGNLIDGDNDDPTDGQGDTLPQTMAFDEDGDNDTTLGLALVNTIRRIDGFVMYYHSDGNTATRTWTLRLQNPVGAVPTGFDAGADRQVLAFAGPSLTVNEDGILYMANGIYNVTVDDNSVATSNHTTAPNPFPFWVHAGSPAQFIIDVASGLEGDKYSAYIFGESWFV